MSFTPLNGTAIYPKCDHTRYVSRSPKQRALMDITFALSFLFFSFFSKPEHQITMAITTIMIFTISSTTWNVLPYLMIT